MVLVVVIVVVIVVMVVVVVVVVIIIIVNSGGGEVGLCLSISMSKIATNCKSRSEEIKTNLM